MISNEHFTIEKLAEILKLSKKTIYAYIKQGKIDAKKEKGVYLILESEKNTSLFVDAIKRQRDSPETAYDPEELLEYSGWHKFLDEFVWLIKVCYSPKSTVKSKRFRLEHLFCNYLAAHKIKLNKLAQVFNSSIPPPVKLVTDDLKRGWYNELAYLMPLKSSTLGLSFTDINLNRESSNQRFAFPSWKITSAYYSLYFYLRSMTLLKFSKFRKEEHGATISCFKENLLAPLERVIWKFPFDIKYVPGERVYRRKIYLHEIEHIKYQYSNHPRSPCSTPLEIFDLLYDVFRKRARIGRRKRKPIKYTLFDYLHDFRVWANYLDIDNLLNLYGSGYKAFIDQNLSLILFFIGGMAELSYIAIFGETQFLKNLQNLYDLLVKNNPELENAFVNTAISQRLAIYNKLGFVKESLTLRYQPNINAVSLIQV